MRTIAALLLVLSSCAVGACPAGAGTGIAIEVQGPGGEVPARYELVVTATGEEPWQVSCGAGAGATTVDGPLSCAAGGGRVALEPRGLEVVVKARGARFTRVEALAAGKLEVGLPALAEPVVTQDYRTGFAAEAGTADFEAMGQAIDTDLGPTRVVKFYMDGLDDEPAVYFQDTRLHPIHYDFVHNVLGKALSLEEFEAQTYHGEDRTAMAGNLVWYPELSAPSRAAGSDLEAPLAVTFFPSDDLTPEQARLATWLIEERVGFAGLEGGSRRLAYLPAGSVQADALATATRSFEVRGLLWLMSEELYGGLTEQRLNPGVAYGTLRRMSPEELATAVVSYRDILLLTRLPNGLPVVGGTISEELQTPLAHVNVAARARGTPNLGLIGASDHPAVAPLLDKLVRFEVTPAGFTLAETTLAEAQTFWAKQGDQPPLIPEADVVREGLLGFAEIGFADALAVGPKAANLAELSHVLGAQAPDGFAVPFHYYDAFMGSEGTTPALCTDARADCVQEGRPEAVCDAARARCEASAEAAEPFFALVARLLDDPEVALDTPLREACLDGLRYAIRHADLDASLMADLDARVLGLAGSGPVRLRSSTNCEDLASFSGAGLYDSTTAYASGKDAASAEIRKVWASVFNFRAFEERAFWNVDQQAVRMGVGVHPAYPEEAANGVLITQNLANPAVVGMYVNVQAGEVSVTNPTDGALPEIFSLVPGPGGLQVQRQRFSSLSPGLPILSEAEVLALYQAAAKLQVHFAPLYDVNPFVLALDLEFKFHGPDRALIVKQVRPYFEHP
jgi:hypothetical protein